MALNPRISLEQWRALVAVVDAGGYAQAAQRINKSQSAVTYAVQKLETLLGVKAFEIHGRKAVLTPTGQLLYRRAHALLEEAEGLERASRSLSAGWEAEIRIAVEIIFPTYVLLATLDRFGQESPHTHVELYESVLGGTQEALLQARVDLAVSPQVPPGFSGESLMRLRFVPVAHPSHPLHHLGRAPTMRDLRAHRQVVVRDTGSTRTAGALRIEAKQRWTVGHMATSILAVRSGYGYAWFPEDKIRLELDEGTLVPLPIADGGERYAELYLVFGDRESAGPGTTRLAALLREAVAAECRRKEKPRREAARPRSARRGGRT